MAFNGGSSNIATFFEGLEAVGGSGSCCITFCRKPSAGSKKEEVTKVRFCVDVLLPFSHASTDLVAAGQGTYEPRTSFCVNGLSDLEYVFQQGRMAAFKQAVRNLAEDVRLEMLKARPTTSNRKVQRKVGSLIKSIGADGLV